LELNNSILSALYNKNVTMKISEKDKNLARQVIATTWDTTPEDIQIDVTLNPSVERIIKAMVEFNANKSAEEIGNLTREELINKLAFTAENIDQEYSPVKAILLAICGALSSRDEMVLALEVNKIVSNILLPKIK
jgi:hypothetical protein